FSTDLPDLNRDRRNEWKGMEGTNGRGWKERMEGADGRESLEGGRRTSSPSGSKLPLRFSSIEFRGRSDPETFEAGNGQAVSCKSIFNPRR
ncbi:MAG: hypothetical protein WBK88_09630, partial [Methanothrix sp.]